MEELAAVRTLWSYTSPSICYCGTSRRYDQGCLAVIVGIPQSSKRVVTGILKQLINTNGEVTWCKEIVFTRQCDNSFLNTRSLMKDESYE